MLLNVPKYDALTQNLIRAEPPPTRISQDRKTWQRARVGLDEREQVVPRWLREGPPYEAEAASAIWVSPPIVYFEGASEAESAVEACIVACPFEDAVRETEAVFAVVFVRACVFREDVLN